jgi:hypothetical protein
VHEYFYCSLCSRDGRWLLAQDVPPVAFQRAGGGVYSRCDLVWLVGERGGVQLEGRLDQRDELGGWCQEVPVDLADGVGDGEVGQVHRDQVHRFADEVGAELGQVGALQVGDPGVGAQPPAELAGAGIDGVDAGRPGVEQGLGEAAGRRA